MKVFKIIFILAVLLIITAITASVTAQVTMGADSVPSSFSVLELISNGNKGMRLPQLTTAQRDTVQAHFGSKATSDAMGLQIFNIDTHCVETWNGTDWISKCGDPFSITPKPACTGLDALPATVWYPYNLGADPAYDTPKKQIKELAELAAVAIAGGATTSNYDTNAAAIAYRLDSTIFGHLYQWGRVKDGHQVRGYDGNTAVSTDVINDAGYDPVTGQILFGTDGYGKHIYSPTTPRDWQKKHTSWIQAQMNTLWGNGSGDISTAVGTSSDGAVLCTRRISGLGTVGSYYQKPVRTDYDPCPKGWRLPTQDEFERLGNYQCGTPQIAEGDVTVPNGTAAQVADATNNPNITWVRVSNGKANTSNAVWTNPDFHANGYAVYNTAVWDAADDGYKDGTLNLFADAAPEPLLFLPAAGDRYSNSAILNYVGSQGFYWSSTVQGPSAYDLGLASNGISTQYENFKTFGFSVRCVCEK